MNAEEREIINRALEDLTPSAEDKVKELILASVAASLNSFLHSANTEQMRAAAQNKAEKILRSYRLDLLGKPLVCVKTDPDDPTRVIGTSPINHRWGTNGHPDW